MEITLDQENEIIPYSYDKKIYLGGKKIGRIHWSLVDSNYSNNSYWTAWCVVSKELSKELCKEFKAQNHSGVSSNNAMLQKIMKVAKVYIFAQKQIGWNNAYAKDYTNLAEIETSLWQVWSIVNQAYGL